MSWFRRTKRERHPATVDGQVEPAPDAAIVRTERALVALAVHARQLTDRVEKLEYRLNDVAERDFVVPSQDDVLEVRVHSAKVAAEVSRLSVNLRAQIDDLAQQLRSQDDRARTLAESIIDLSDGLDTTAPDVGDDQGDWARTA